MNSLPPLLAQLTGEPRLKRYPKGQTIIYQGERPQEVVILAKGYIKLYDIDKEGNEKILHIVGSGALVPLVFFSGGNSEVKWFYAALTDCDVYVFALEDMARAVRDNNELMLFLVRRFSNEVHELLARLSSMGKSTARMKVVAALKFLSQHNAAPRKNGWYRVDFPVNHQLLADMTGVTRESAAVIMKELVSKGSVRNPGQAMLEICPHKLP